MTKLKVEIFLPRRSPGSNRQPGSYRLKVTGGVMFTMTWRQLIMKTLKRINKLILVLVLVVMFAGCAGMSTTQQRVLSGGAIGAGSGAAIGAITGGSPGVGAAVGGAAGALGGYLYDQSQPRGR